ncbi:anthranilate phosphoribosyltransferase [Algisphaera agarilytica]|uniref:Anthranilate phosphoribosyltransferase n=1 Tax=Algisphaera agarilytica TaxID=1385975 RepID=A0A7X0H629_9BACT|nr:anthranilate phosphoribosyltransferase [Algisphaera agarilytica]MBB6429983.1 anthranilate phosphoribosyltransferase [Algisphaera agarilytica]
MKQLLSQLVDGQPLSAEQAIEGFELIMSGQAEPAQTGAMLALIAQRGPTVDEVVGAATVMRQKAVPVNVPEGLTIIDTCGAGGTGSTFFNISTTAALVAAGAGRPLGLGVAKHGNRSVTSRSGSSNVLENLGVNLQADPDVLTKCLDEAGMCFCFAPAHHPAMKYAGPVRAALGFRTVFNLIGPLTNPAGAKRQLIGVPSPEVADLMSQALLRLDAEHCLLVHSVLPDGHSLGELTTFGPAQAVQVHHDMTKSYPIDPAALGMPFALPDSVTIQTPADSAVIVKQVLDNEAGPARDITVLNAAAALQVGGVADSLEEGLELAAAAIADGRAKNVLDTLIQLTNA